MKLRKKKSIKMKSHYVCLRASPPASACRMQSQRGGRDGVLLEDGAAPGVRVSRGPVHGHPHPEGLAVWALSGSLPLPDQTPQRYASIARQDCPTCVCSCRCVQIQARVYSRNVREQLMKQR